MRRLLDVGLILSLITAGACAATSTGWRATDWEHPQAIIVAPGTIGIPYVEQAELGPTAFGASDNRFGSVTATWSDAETSWLAASAPHELDNTGAVYVFSRANDSAVWHQEARLTASDGKKGDGFGDSVAIGGNTVVVGAPSHEVGSITGAIYTFIRDKTTGAWSQRGAALGAPTAGAFGTSVALEGDTLVVGAPSTATSGHVYVYQNFGGSWSTVGSLSPSDSPPNAYFGGAIALDSGRLLIGARSDSTRAQYEGSAYVFAYESATNSWEQQQKLIPYPEGAVGDSFGQSVALAGPFAVVAASGRNSSQGAVDLFAFDPVHSAWIKRGSLQGPDGPEGFFGNSLALSSNVLAVGSLGKTDANNVYLYTTAAGTATFQSRLPATAQSSIPGSFGASISWSNDELLISAPEADIDSEDRGIVHAFSSATSGWIERQPIYAMGDQGEIFSTSTAISGNVAVIRAPNQSDYYGEQGAADIFNRAADGTWIWQQELSDNYGGPVAIDGNTIVIGAPQQAFGDNHNQGAAYIYVKSGDTWTEQAELADLVNGKAGDFLGESVALYGDTALIGAPEIDSNTGCVFVFVRSGTTWTKQAKLTVSGASGGRYFGASIALHGDTALISGPYIPGDAGSAYLFLRSGTIWTQTKKLMASDGTTGDNFGGALALSDKAAFIGAGQKQVGANYEQGRVYVFSGPDWNTESTIDSPAGIEYGYFGSSIAVDGKRLVIGEPGQDTAYLFYGNQDNWSLQSSLLDMTGSYFGRSVAASNGNMLVGATSDGTGSTHGGRAYIFQDDRIFADDFN